MSAGAPGRSSRAAFPRIALIGLGLIASSMAHALRAKGLCDEITGYARSAETRAIALELFCDRVTDSAAEAVAGADLVVLAVPVGVMGEIAAEIAPHLKPGAVVTDVGSVKEAVIEAVAPHIPAGVHFIPGHPLAGTEYSGPRSGFATLFENRWWLLTPLEGQAPGPLARLRALLEAIGANVDEMEPKRHDLVLAVVSHTPHLIAFTMVGVADHLSRVTQEEVIKYSASGFRDFTRIAASDPTMWRDVFLTNKEAVLDILGRFTEELFMLQRQIRMGEGEQLHAYFSRTREIRRGIIEAGQDTSAPDFGRAARHKGDEAGSADAGLTESGPVESDAPDRAGA
ncbi:prephenate/arogenate dehydrogenase family protein [Rhodobacter sp. 24-YEA-8]|uniref:prephenate/arogenate dehydrogenase family protein n=1 Tax=Rhodobacter sp. 24-YEA-8 TaxID=1884310 RepID=UPI000898B442|nr:prephenate/arogenate dehydrogenase family protein [Rhodobacter sp. 24-YEA-8]SEB39178.1 prephenate dehydrogenase [Rhodobacter sp. 24-YEA-8]